MSCTAQLNRMNNFTHSMMLLPFAMVFDGVKGTQASKPKPEPRSWSQIISITGGIALACFAAYKAFPLIVGTCSYMLKHHPVITVGVGAGVLFVTAIPGIVLATTAFYFLVKSEP